MVIGLLGICRIEFGGQGLRWKRFDINKSSVSVKKVGVESHLNMNQLRRSSTTSSQHGTVFM